MPATATNDANASVEIPVSPCPIEQPNAITPPMPISAAPPAVVSLPFKLIFFVLVDGWSLVARSLIQSYGG